MSQPVPLAPPRKLIDVEIDGADGPRARGRHDPGRVPRRRAWTRPRSATRTTSRPLNACRVCVVEVEGARTLVPACSRAAEAGMKVTTDTERVAALAQARDGVPGLERGDGAHRARRPPVDGRVRRRPANGSARAMAAAAGGGAGRARRRATTTSPRTPRSPRACAQPVKIDNELYVRDYSRVHPLLQVRGGVRRRRAEHVRDRRRRPRVRRPDLHRVRRGPGRERVRVLRQLHRRVPHRRADVHLRARRARGRHVGRGGADRHEHDLPVLRRGVRARAPRAGQRDREGDVAGGPLRHERAPLHQGPVRVPVRAEPPAPPRGPRRGAAAGGADLAPDRPGRHGDRARRRALDAVRLRQARGDRRRRPAPAPRRPAPRGGLPRGRSSWWRPERQEPALPLAVARARRARRRRGRGAARRRAGRAGRRR